MKENAEVKKDNRMNEDMNENINEDNRVREDNNLARYQSMPVARAVISNALPAMAAMLMTLIYNLADTFFIGQTKDAYQVAAVSLATPVFLIFMAVGSAFGIGGTSVISRAFGEGNNRYARKVSSFCMWGCVICGTVISACLLIFMNPILRLIGASEATWGFTKIYLTIVAFCGPFAVISSCFSNVLRAEGQANRAMAGQIVGNLLNITLDAVFIMGFHWDIVGCALATLIGEIAGACYYLIYFLRRQSSLSISIRDFTMKEHVAAGTLVIGIPASLGSLLMSVSQIVMNAQMAKHGDMAVAGIGVAMKIVMITGMLSMGIGQGVQPLLGFCIGSGNRDRFRKIMSFSLFFATAIGTVLTICCYVFNSPIIGAFLNDEGAFACAQTFSGILLCTGPLFGIYYVLCNALQAMGAATASFIINISRQGLVYIPMLFIMDAWLGASGLAWAQPAADVISVIMAALLYGRNFQKKSRKNSGAGTKR
ncbi:MAG: MATE family efflux transporter [Lachnospiraceae bacterium]